jgi:hypothetical protein
MAGKPQLETADHGFDTQVRASCEVKHEGSHGSSTIIMQPACRILLSLAVLILRVAPGAMWIAHQAIAACSRNPKCRLKSRAGSIDDIRHPAFQKRRHA